MDIASKSVDMFHVSESSSWEHCIVENSIYAGTVQGELIEISAEDMSIVKKIDLCKKNIYSVVHDGGIIYTLSQDTIIKAVDTASFPTINIAKKAVKGMAKIVGVSNGFLIVAAGNISL